MGSDVAKPLSGEVREVRGGGRGGSAVGKKQSHLPRAFGVPSGLGLGGQAPPDACVALLLLGSENEKCHLSSTGHSNPHGLNTSKEVLRALLIR